MKNATDVLAPVAEAKIDSSKSRHQTMMSGIQRPKTNARRNKPAALRVPIQAMMTFFTGPVLEHNSTI